MIASLRRGVKAIVVGLGDAGLLALPIGLTVEDELGSRGLQPVGGLGEERIDHLRHTMGSGFEVTTVAAARWRSTMSS